MVSALVFNTFSLAHPAAVFYYGPGDTLLAHADEERGGPLVAENDHALQSGLPVSPLTTVGGTRSLFNTESATAVASANPAGTFSISSNGLRQYKVRRGDTLPALAKKFNISEDTIRLANGGVRKPRVGTTLTILPVSGVLYHVHEGDSIEAIAATNKVDPDAVKRQNPNYQELLADGSGTLILPTAKPSAKMLSSTPTDKLPEIKNFFTLPLAGLNTGELHDYNAVDIVNKCGAPVRASAAGTVITDSALKSDGAKGWNDGYGLFVLVEHENGTKTRYAHLDKIFVKVGDVVNQGDQIGLVGNTGNAEGPTGCHLHFEVLGAKNPFATK